MVSENEEGKKQKTNEFHWMTHWHKKEECQRWVNEFHLVCIAKSGLDQTGVSWVGLSESERGRGAGVRLTLSCGLMSKLPSLDWDMCIVVISFILAALSLIHNGTKESQDGARILLRPRNSILYDPPSNCSLCQFKRKQLLADCKANTNLSLWARASSYSCTHLKNKIK